MAKIKNIKKETNLLDEIHDDYKKLLMSTGADIYKKQKVNTANYQVLSAYSVKPKRERGPKKKKRKK